MSATGIENARARPALSPWILLGLMGVAAVLSPGLAAAKIPGVGLDYYPGYPDPWAGGTLNRDAFIERYGMPPDHHAYWPGMVAELFFVNAKALRTACLAGALGDPAVYDCVPKMVEQMDLARATSRPDWISGVHGEVVYYNPNNFYCKWWVNQGPDPGKTPHNPIEIRDESLADGPFVARAAQGWACPVYYQNVLPEEACTQDGDTLCLLQRFELEVSWKTPQGATGKGTAIPLTEDTGGFWFFNDKNYEMMVKLRDGCVVNQSFWVFAGGLTNVEVELRVTDTVTGAARTYTNPLLTPFEPLQDTSAFACP